MSAKEIIVALWVAGSLSVLPSAFAEAVWWDFLKEKPPPPKSVEERSREAGDVGIRPGLLAPDFDLIKLGGGKIRLSSYRGAKAVLLNFWATWCVPCRKEMPSLEALSRAYAGRGLAVLGVNIDADGPESADAAAFIREVNVTFPIVFDPKNRAARKYAVHGLPVTYLINRTGRIEKRVIGDKDWMHSDVRARVERLLESPNTENQ